MLNSNFMHNVLNVLIVLLGAAGPILVATGCTHDTVLDKFDCSGSWLPPLWLPPLLAVLGGAKIIMNLMRDGPFGLIKPQPPVADEIKTIVTPVVKAEPGQADAVVEVKTNYNRAKPGPKTRK